MVTTETTEEGNQDTILVNISIKPIQLKIDMGSMAESEDSTKQKLQMPSRNISMISIIQTSLTNLGHIQAAISQVEQGSHPLHTTWIVKETEELSTIAMRLAQALVQIPEV